MDPWQLSVFVTVFSAVISAALLGIWAMLRKFVREQREVNERNKQFERSMQRAEIIRYFRITVEQGDPITPEELSHLEACYEAYHASGGNGTGNLMYEKVREHARIVTTATAVERS